MTTVVCNSQGLVVCVWVCTAHTYIQCVSMHACMRVYLFVSMAFTEVMLRIVLG